MIWIKSLRIFTMKQNYTILIKKSVQTVIFWVPQLNTQVFIEELNKGDFNLTQRNENNLRMIEKHQHQSFLYSMSEKHVKELKR